MKDEILAHRDYAHVHGLDTPAVTNWKWSLPPAQP
jgi:xylulose-5-phosphate/fructose-6-phosphate phosphoketolase